MEKDKQALLIEAIQDVTVNCYDKLINKYEDSRLVLETCRAWAAEFEDWWWSLSEDEQDERDYLLSIDDFCERHLRAELNNGQHYDAYEDLCKAILKSIQSNRAYIKLMSCNEDPTIDDGISLLTLLSVIHDELKLLINGTGK